MLIAALLIVCCSLLRIASLIPLVCSENLTRHAAQDKNEVVESRAVLDTRLPWYTSGFE